jgi:hypothetical protein
MGVKTQMDDWHILVGSFLKSINKVSFMKRFLSGLIAVAAVLLPLSQNAQAHWGYYHHSYGYHRTYWQHRYWHHGYRYAGYWHPGYWYSGPVTVIVAPY